MTTSLHSLAECLEIVGASTSWNPWNRPGL